MGIELPLRAIRGQIASSIDLVIHLGRLKTGERRLLEIVELLGLDGDDYKMRTLFQYEKGQLNMLSPLFNDRNLLSYGEEETYKKAVEIYENKFRFGEEE